MVTIKEEASDDSFANKSAEKVQKVTEVTVEAQKNQPIEEVSSKKKEPAKKTGKKINDIELIFTPTITYKDDESQKEGSESSERQKTSTSKRASRSKAQENKRKSQAAPAEPAKEDKQAQSPFGSEIKSIKAEPQYSVIETTSSSSVSSSPPSSSEPNRKPDLADVEEKIAATAKSDERAVKDTAQLASIDNKIEHQDSNSSMNTNRNEDEKAYKAWKKSIMMVLNNITCHK